MNMRRAAGPFPLAKELAGRIVAVAPGTAPSATLERLPAWVLQDMATEAETEHRAGWALRVLGIRKP